jgi:hypothetical protein
MTAAERPLSFFFNGKPVTGIGLVVVGGVVSDITPFADDQQST